jgi:hypothetical protein
MNSIAVSSIVLACVFGGALFGMFLPTRLPEDHLSPKSTDLVKMGMGLIGTMAAMVLGLMFASAKNTYDTGKGELTALSAKVVMLDRVLAHYGPDAQEARNVLRGAIVRALDQGWTVVATLFVCALSVSGAIFLILEMYSPFSGVIRVSSDPLRTALSHLGK